MLKKKRFKYMGIADCYGVECLIIFERRKMFPLYLRALANRHRHAVYFEVWLTVEEARKIKALVLKRRWQEALRLLKNYRVIFPEKTEKSLRVVGG